MKTVFSKLINGKNSEIIIHSGNLKGIKNVLRRNLNNFPKIVLQISVTK